MGLLSRLRGWFGTGKGNASPDGRRSGYDLSKTTVENENQFKETDSLDAKAANSPETRRVMRERSRYAYDNNGYCSGLVDTLAEDTVGTGPRPQLQIPGASTEAVQEVERLHKAWQKATGLTEKLIILDTAKTKDGEGFGVIASNPAVLDHPAEPGVSLDLRLYECDQVESPLLDPADPNAVSGLRYDEFGNPTEYHFLKEHPGANSYLAGYLDFERIPAKRVIHWFRKRRAGQYRGTPDIAPAIEPLEQLRRYTKAVLGAAEWAACMVGLLKTNLSAAVDDSEGVEEMDVVEFVRNKLLTLPEGYDVHQMKAEQPTTSYGDFKAEILNEAGRPVQAPFNVVSGNSSKYNYSSGRLDHQLYHRSIRVKRGQIGERILDPLFRAWAFEALKAGILPAGLPPISRWVWTWQWDGFGSIDPVKDATSNETKLRSGQTTLMEISASDGKDWEERMIQRARERDLAKKLGYPDLADVQPAGGAVADKANKAGDPGTDE